MTGENDIIEEKITFSLIFYRRITQSDATSVFFYQTSKSFITLAIAFMLEITTAEDYKIIYDHL
jgi:hypothetical protein